MLKKPKPIVLPKKKQQVIALIGPTGVGKTTTIAKLAANFAIKHNKRLALVTSEAFSVFWTLFRERSLTLHGFSLIFSGIATYREFIIQHLFHGSLDLGPLHPLDSQF